MRRFDVRRDVTKLVGWILFALFILFLLGQFFGLWRAYQRTPDAVAIARQGELKLSNLSDDRRAILLAVEDPGFATHHGIDWSTPGAGMTTIAQALAKILYFDHFQPGVGKIQQSLIARFIIDHALTKDEQVAAFLNLAYFGTVHGRDVTGFADASRTYFDRPFFALTTQQYEALVAMLIAPNALDPIRHPRANAERVARIERMVRGECRPTGVSDVYYDACKAPARPAN